ncbi:MAG: hypothetical protein NT010_15390 [Proteobacteria bacterium]|nr:hypothetical protein [Pseudomonadota bacterium]
MDKKKIKVLIRDLGIFWFLVIIFVLIWRHNIAVTGFIITVYLIRYFIWPDNEDHVVFIAGAVLGSIAEIIATKAGTWSYALPTFLNIPIWLPFAWGFVSVLIIRIAQVFLRNRY